MVYSYDPALGPPTTTQTRPAPTPPAYVVETIFSVIGQLIRYTLQPTGGYRVAQTYDYQPGTGRLSGSFVHREAQAPATLSGWRRRTIHRRLPGGRNRSPVEPHRPMTEVLLVHDYGQGGAWAVVRAESPADAHGRFPELTVVGHRPGCMSDRDLEQLRASVLDVRQPTGLLADILRDRENE